MLCYKILTFTQTFFKIIHWKHCLKIPGDLRVSQEAENCIRSLLCDAGQRASIETIKKHPFFESINWETLREQEPPFKPEVSNLFDLRYFPEEGLEKAQDEFMSIYNSVDETSGNNFDLPYVGFTFRNMETLRM